MHTVAYKHAMLSYILPQAWSHKKQRNVPLSLA